MTPAESPVLVPVGEAELPILRRIFEYYLYDFSEMLGSRVREHGGFVREEKWESELARPEVERWLIRADGAWAGFALVAHQSWLDGRSGIHDVDEFFVMRGHRRRGVGREVAARLFEMFSGTWEVRVLQSNPNAAAFWRAVIAAVTQDDFTETAVDSPRWKGPVFSFSSPGPRPAD